MSDRIEKFLDKTQSNEYFRHVLLTGERTQAVAMCIAAGEDVGTEVHPNNEQILLCVEGNGKAILDKHEMPFNTGDLVVVRAGTEHNFLNTGDASMKIATIYSPPHHPDGTIHKTKADALEAEAKE